MPATDVAVAVIAYRALLRRGRALRVRPVEAIGLGE